MSFNLLHLPQTFSVSVGFILHCLCGNIHTTISYCGHKKVTVLPPLDSFIHTPLTASTPSVILLAMQVPKQHINKGLLLCVTSGLLFVESSQGQAKRLFMPAHSGISVRLCVSDGWYCRQSCTGHTHLPAPEDKISRRADSTHRHMDCFVFFSV